MKRIAVLLLFYILFNQAGAQEEYDHRIVFHIRNPYQTYWISFFKNGDSLNFKLEVKDTSSKATVATLSIPFNYDQADDISNILFYSLRNRDWYSRIDKQKFVKRTERKSDRFADMVRYYYSPKQSNIFSKYEENYFTFYNFLNPKRATGIDTSLVKFQLSFKYDMTRSALKNKMFFGTTIKAFWDLYDWKNSAPINEINLKPAMWWEHFIRTPEYYVNIYSISTGVFHESDGQQQYEANGIARNLKDRGWNRCFTRAKFIIDGLHAYKWTCFGFKELDIQPTLYWYTFGLSDENPDIVKYYGKFDIQADLKIGQINTRFMQSTGYTLSAKWRPKINASHTSELMLEAKIGPWNMNFVNYSLPFLFIQYRRGYGEGLINYNRFQESLRIGISLNLN